MPKRYHYFIIIFFLLLVSGYCLQRDIKIDNNYTIDLRKRVVGARLQMDGKSPYFYSWKEKDGVRYYDHKAYDNDSTQVSSITASPFFHHLLYPIADLPQRQISRIWLGVEYFMLIACMFIAFSFTINIYQKYCVAIFFALVLFTEAWMMHIAYGQSYIIIPALAFGFLFCIRRQERIDFVFLAGIIAAIMILTKPTLILFFVPFAFFIKKIPIKNILLLFIPIIILASYSLLNKNERGFWNSYQKAIAGHIKIHLGLEKMPDSNTNLVSYKRWEGWDMEAVNKAHAVSPLSLQVERCNIWVLEQKFFHEKVSIKSINAVLLIISSVFILLFYFYHRKKEYLSFTILPIFGFCLYTISEYLSPITRYEYYSVQSAFPVFLIAAFYNKKMMPIYILLLIGLLLNIFDFPFIMMRHTVGQLVILFASLWLCFSPKSRLLS